MFGILVTMFAGIFWLFRIVISLMYTSEAGFPIEPLNVGVEIPLLFVIFVCIVFIAKRKMIGAVAYLIAHWAYFGVDAYKNIEAMTQGQATTTNSISLFVSIIAVVLPILAIMDIGVNTEKTKDGKTDFFYATDAYDRNLDDRDDKNQYKF